MREEHSEIKISRGDILRMTADVVAAYVGNNPLPATQIPEVINTVYGSLRKINVVTRNGGDEPPKAAVPVRKSITPRSEERRVGKEGVGTGISRWSPEP